MGVSASASVTVGELQPVLQRAQARLLAGERGLGRAVTWASTMRARLPAFETFQGGELALLSLATLRALRSQLVALSLSMVVEQLADTGVSGIAVAGIEGAILSRDDAQALEEAKARADLRELPLFSLPPGTPLDKLEAEVVALVVARRERQTGGRIVADPLTARFRATLRGEALDALLSGTYAGEPQMRSRAAQLGHDLAQPHAALWLELDTAALRSIPALPAEEAAPLADEFAEALRLALDAWARARSTQVVALLPLSRAERGIEGLAERVQALLARQTSGGGGGKGIGPWAAGIGEPAIGPTQVRRSASEAHDAARLGLQVFGPCHVARIGDLGVYQLLLVLRQSGELESFVRRTLAPLGADAKNREQHFETLEAYFACNGNVTQAAKDLNLHRNSLLYRLGNIRELLARDLDDPELRLALQLALKGRRVLDMRDV